MNNSAHITLPPPVRQEIQELARKSDRSFSAMCRVLLYEALENRLEDERDDNDKRIESMEQEDDNNKRICQTILRVSH